MPFLDDLANFQPSEANDFAASSPPILSNVVELSTLKKEKP